jgi:hypothetical protein
METLYKLLETIEKNSINNKVTIENVELFVKAWKREAQSLQLLQPDVIWRSEQLPQACCTLNSSTCGKGTGCKYPHCNL